MSVHSQSALAANTASTAAIVLGEQAVPLADAPAHRGPPGRSRRLRAYHRRLAHPRADGGGVMTLWYTARGAALAALIALSVATALGALVSLPSRNAARRVIVQYVHRSAAVLGLGLLALHVTAIVLDSKAHVGLLRRARAVHVRLPADLGRARHDRALPDARRAALGFARGRLAASARAARVWRRLHRCPTAPGRSRSCTASSPGQTSAPAGST